MLENEYEITSLQVLAETEERASKKKTVALFDDGTLNTLEAGKFASLQIIHRVLFEDIYDFAGKIRTVNLAKGNFRFAPLMYLDAALQNIDKTCSCGACSVDGGHDYLRRCAKSLDDFVDLSEFQKQDDEVK